MFLMNFLFDFNDLNGIFSGDRRDAGPENPRRSELYTSKNWLKLIPNAAVGEPPAIFPALFDPDKAAWNDLLDMDSGSHFMPSTPATRPDENHIGIRLGLDPETKISLAGLKAKPPTIQISVCFGRPYVTLQTRASPFYAPASELDPKLQVVQTTFIQTFTAPTGKDDLLHPTWFRHLGLVQYRPMPNENRNHRYQFSVGIIVTSADGTKVHHYSHDPEMDIGE